MEHAGTINSAGLSQGHYTCDVKPLSSSGWFRTNDNRLPVKLPLDKVSKNAYVILYERT